MNNKRFSAGFTLAEIAIVLAIIGIMFGAVVKGMEMAQNARLKQVVKQVNSYKGAMFAFKDKYGELPGDFSNAVAMLPGCEPPNCVDGNGDTILGTPVNIWQGGQHDIDTENTQFWRHLLFADLTSGISGGDTIAWGETHPASPLAGGYTVVQSIRSRGHRRAGAASQASPEGLNIRLQANPTAANVETATGTTPMRTTGDMPVSPHEAHYIDQLIDDGIPGSGNVRSYEMGNPRGPSCENTYDVDNMDRDCMMSFKID